MDAFERDAVKRIVLVRPAVEAGERLGFLPGDLAQKVDPYLRPLYDALYDLMGFEKVGKLFERGSIEIAPLAYMRGRTLNHSFIILDEAQNTTPEQMKMFLTRIGFGTKAVITGDVTQIDLARGQKSGLVDAQEVLKDVRGIAFTLFTSEDVVRHPLVARIVNAYEAQTERAEQPGATIQAMAASRAKLSLSVQYATARAACSGPYPAASAVRRLRWSVRRAGHAAHRGRARRPAPEPRLPRQGLRHQRAHVRLSRPALAGRRHRAVRAGGAPRGRSTAQGAARRTTRIWWCTACCICRAMTTSASDQAAVMEARETEIVTAGVS